MVLFHVCVYECGCEWRLLAFELSFPEGDAFGGEASQDKKSSTLPEVTIFSVVFGVFCVFGGGFGGIVGTGEAVVNVDVDEVGVGTGTEGGIVEDAATAAAIFLITFEPVDLQFRF